MRKDLTSEGFSEWRSPEDVQNDFTNAKGTMFVVVNSVCGCAAGAARPGVKAAIAATSKLPGKMTTVFAGQDLEATNEARKHFAPYPPSSPAMALFKDGELVHFIERHQIEGRSAMMIADHLKMIFEEHC
jgi:putative YphP/YqiW family bacilliredoxin